VKPVKRPARKDKSSPEHAVEPVLRTPRDALTSMSRVVWKARIIAKHAPETILVAFVMLTIISLEALAMLAKLDAMVDISLEHVTDPPRRTTPLACRILALVIKTIVSFAQIHPIPTILVQFAKLVITKTMVPALFAEPSVMMESESKELVPELEVRIPRNVWRRCSVDLSYRVYQLPSLEVSVGL